MTPTVSVIITVLNGEPYVKLAIESVLGQTLRELELIVIDDGSTDTTRDTVRSFSDSRLTLLENETNRGQSFSRNRAMAGSRGRYIAAMDADDVCRPDRLEKQVAFLEAHPEVGVVGSRVEKIDEQGRVFGDKPFPLTHGLILWNMLAFTNPMCHSAIVFRREILDVSGPYDEQVMLHVDRELLSRMILRTRFANLPENLVQYRSYAESLSRRNREKGLHITFDIRRRLIRDLTGLEASRELLMAPLSPPLGDDVIEDHSKLLISLYGWCRERRVFDETELPIATAHLARRLLDLSRRDGRVPGDQAGRHYWRSVLPKPLAALARGIFPARRD